MRKFLFTLLCFCLLLTSVACTQPPQPSETDQTSQTTQAPQPSETPQTSQTTQAPQPSQTPRELYDDIISEYTALLTAKSKGEQLSAPDTVGMDERDAAISEALYGIVNSLKDAASAESLGYGFKDMDGNGTPELILLTKYTSVRAIFTISDSKPLLLEAVYGGKNYITFATKSRFFITHDTTTDNIQQVTYYTCRVDGDKMAYDAVYGEVYDHDKKETVERFQMVDGERTLIDRETLNALRLEYTKSQQPGYNETGKLLAPRIYFPLKDNVINENLPVADFSSYAAILETYKAISTCLDKFDSFAFHTGNYDNLFAFADDTAFEYYTRLLYAAYHANYYTGYDELDLNGDGQDELVIMNEDYSIKAIFTQKNGIPVLLDVFNYEVCWLDDQGLIHVDNNGYYELEYSVYEFTKNGDYDLVYSILVAENGNRYLTENGKTEQITFEKSLELYHDEYCRYSEPFEPYEHTRNVSNLTYTPLTEPEKDLIKVDAGKTWRKTANLEKTTGNKYGAYGNTYATFSNATDTQMNVHFRYEFISYYPDPDRENYVLDDVTETFLDVTARAENGAFVFDEGGIRGRIEFGNKYIWLIIEKSTDERFAVGHHCYEKYVPQE